MKILFLTGNAGKLREARQIMGEGVTVESREIDLPEIQSTRVEDVIEQKLNAAYAVVRQPVICEDTGVFIKSMNGFPGALIKFYLEHLGNKGIAELNGGSAARAETVIGYHDGTGVTYFKGTLGGTVAARPMGTGFGWDPVFVPKGHDRSLAQMSPEEKNRISMRAKAFRKLRKHLRAAAS